jgi:hypothetical protein
MKPKLTHSVGVALTLVIGATLGVTLQKYFGDIHEAWRTRHRLTPASTAMLTAEDSIP